MDFAKQNSLPDEWRQHSCPRELEQPEKHPGTDQPSTPAARNKGAHLIKKYRNWLPAQNLSYFPRCIYYSIYLLLTFGLTRVS